jgi:hypothetical protein
MLLLLQKYVVFIIFFALLALGGLFAYDQHKANKSDAATQKWIAKVAQDDSLIKDLVAQRDNALTARAQFVPVYTAGKTQIIHDAAGNAQATKGVTDAFALADKQKALDDRVIAVDDSVIKKQQGEITDLKNKPEPYVKRVQWRAGIGYAAIQQEKSVFTAPAVRAGMDYRILGNLGVSVDVQMTMPGKGKSNPTMQETALVQYRF